MKSLNVMSFLKGLKVLGTNTKMGRYLSKEGVKGLYKNWTVHNIVAHPVMQICTILGLESLARKIHDGTLPSD